jgi:hypothetical protein
LGGRASRLSRPRQQRTTSCPPGASSTEERSGHYRTVLVDHWKLQVSERPPALWLFDMQADPTERTNLAAARLDKVHELSRVLAQQEAQMVPPAWPSLIEGPIAVDHPLDVPDRADDEWVQWAN